MSTKPELHLSSAVDLQSLVDLWEKLTGKKASEEDVREAAELLASTKATSPITTSAAASGPEASLEPGTIPHMGDIALGVDYSPLPSPSGASTTTPGRKPS